MTQTRLHHPGSRCVLHDLPTGECAHCRGETEPTHWPATPWAIAPRMPAPKRPAPKRPARVPTEARSTDPAVNLRRDLAAIATMANQLAARGIDLAASRLMPGGEATTQQAPVASHEAWANRLDTTETHAADRRPPVYAIADNEDDEHEWGPAQILAYWSETWRQQMGKTTDRLTLASEVAFLRRPDTLAWASANEPHLTQYHSDIHTARTRLENITRDGERATRSRVTCDRCPHPERLIQVHGRTPEQDTWKAPCCDTRFTEDDKNRALARQLHSRGAARWINRTEAISALMVQGWTEHQATRIIDHPDVAHEHDPRGRPIIWWPDAWTTHRLALQDRELRHAATNRTDTNHVS